MSSIILPVVGGASGFFLGGPQGALLGGNLIGMAAGLFGKSQRVNLPSQEGPRLADLRAQTSTYGNVIPKIYGTIRHAGNIIWATDIKEVRSDSTVHHHSGGKGGGRKVTTSQTTTTYSYYITLAIAICEGPIDEVIRVWADSMVLTQNSLSSAHGKYNVHLGDEEQQPDDILAKYNKAGTFPAYRGLAYIVIEDFPLADYGNRIPNFTFEVRRSVRFKPSLEDKIKEIVLIPGSGEFVYSTNLVTKQDGFYGDDGFISHGIKTSINMHNYEGKPNAVLAIDNLIKTLPNIDWVAVVVTWFATSTDTGKCQIIPKVEFHGTTKTYPHEWSVCGYHRESAETVLRFDDNTPTYGGTPSDNTVIEIISELKSRNINVMLYPMVFVDEIVPDPKPWRGRIHPYNSYGCNNWFTKDNGYNRFILHYATITKGLVDAFIIGSELVGMTSFIDENGNYPAVSQLLNLASAVRRIIDPSTKITYAADWSEYHSTDGIYNLDPLWASKDIDFVGIDSYFPLTEDLPQSQITKEKISDSWERGEGWDYYCDSNRNKIKYKDETYAWKNLEYWWSNYHINPDGKSTGWIPKMKPIWFTEMGFPSVDACANQPNVFYDPSSRESFFPRGSKRRINFQAQRDALEASLDYLHTRSNITGNEELVPKSFIWCWDARPFPFWPDLERVWKDSRLWITGHWVNGKLGNSTLGAIIAELLESSGLSKSDFDVRRLTDIVDGYIILHAITAREAIEQLQAAYFFDVVESDGIIKFIPRGGIPSITIPQEEIVPSNKNGIQDLLDIVRAQELELPQCVNVTYIDRHSSYNPATQSSQRQSVKAIEKVIINLPIVMNSTLAKKISDITLYSTWKERISFTLTLPPKYCNIEPADVITVMISDISHTMRIVKTDIDRNALIKINGVAEDSDSYDFYSPVGNVTSNLQLPPHPIPNTIIEVLDLPNLINNSSETQSLYIAASPDGEGWRGAAIYSSNDGGESTSNNFNTVIGISAASTMGIIVTNLDKGISVTWDESNQVEVVLTSGELSSASEFSIFNGANIAVIGDELIQFQYAQLIGDKRYRLSRLLRGRCGTESSIINHKAGTRFILLDSSLSEIKGNGIGRTIHYKAVTVGNALGSAEEKSFTYHANSLKPFSPVHISGIRDDKGNITIIWIRRSRINNDWRDCVDIPLGEESEKYHVDILDGDRVVRTIETTTQSAIYEAFDQITDFKEIKDKISIKVYQLSATVGRGQAARAVI